MKFNRLLSAMVASITELKKAIRGLVVMSQVSVVVVIIVVEPNGIIKAETRPPAIQGLRYTWQSAAFLFPLVAVSRKGCAANGQSPCKARSKRVPLSRVTAPHRQAKRWPLDFAGSR